MDMFQALRREQLAPWATTCHWQGWKATLLSLHTEQVPPVTADTYILTKCIVSEAPQTLTRDSICYTTQQPQEQTELRYPCIPALGFDKSSAVWWDGGILADKTDWSSCSWSWEPFVSVYSWRQRAGLCKKIIPWKSSDGFTSSMGCWCPCRKAAPLRELPQNGGRASEPHWRRNRWRGKAWAWSSMEVPWGKAELHRSEQGRSGTHRGRHLLCGVWLSHGE